MVDFIVMLFAAIAAGLTAIQTAYAGLTFVSAIACVGFVVFVVIAIALFIKRRNAGRKNITE